jgi:hypothetical protein
LAFLQTWVGAEHEENFGAGPLYPFEIPFRSAVGARGEYFKADIFSLKAEQPRLGRIENLAK